MKERDHVENLGVDGENIKCILNKLNGLLQIGFIWLK